MGDPDAYAGDVHDLVSQQKYMWNDNNPVAYSDPSGYDPNWNLIDPLTIMILSTLLQLKNLL